MISKGVLFERFAGREEELALLSELREKTSRNSEPSCVTISGSRGIGKSRLVREFLRRTNRVRGVVLEIACDSIVPTPYAAALALLESARLTARDFLPIEDAFAILDHVRRDTGKLDAEGESALYHAFITAIQLYAARRAHVVLIVEDAQECDVASLALIAMLIRRSKHTPLMVITTASGLAGTDASGRIEALARIERSADFRISLEPLRLADIAKSIEIALPGLPAATVRELAARSEGNPFFAEELARLGRDAGASAATSTLRSATIGRFEALGIEHRGVLQAAAVIGREFDIGLLYDIANAGEREVDAALQICRDSGLLTEGTRSSLRFSHALFRESLEESMPRSEAKRLHASIADRLEGGPARDGLFALAWHRWMAEDPVKTIVANERAADDATAINAHAEAAECYARVLTLATSGDDTYLRVGPKAALAYATVGRFDRALPVARALIDRFEVAERYDEALEIATRTISWAITSGEKANADALVARARIFAGKSANPKRLVEFEVSIALSAYASSRGTEALDTLQRVESLLEGCSPLTELRYRNTRALANFAAGNVRPALNDLERSLHIAIAEGNVRGELAVINNYCGIMVDIGETALVIERVSGALDRAMTTDLIFAQAVLSLVKLRALISLGDLRAAGRAAHAAIDLDTPFTHLNAEILATSAFVAQLLDDDALAARASADEAIDLATSTGFPACICHVASLAARAALKSNPRQAAAYLNIAWIEDGFATCDAAVAECVAAVGDPEQVEATRSTLVRNSNDSANLAAAPRLAFFEAALAARRHAPIESRSAAETAARGFRELNMPLDEASSLEYCGRLDKAAAIYERIGARAEHARLVERAPLPDRPAEKLTGREEQVCRLIALGLTNREAAAKLAIGARTTETHLANAYRKLGLRTRAQLAAYLAAGAPLVSK